MRAERAVVVVKLDGERSSSDAGRPYTVVLSGGTLPSGDYIHTECATLEDALSRAIVEYARKCWHVEV
jgi:hypothetical protein